MQRVSRLSHEELSNYNSVYIQSMVGATTDYILCGCEKYSILRFCCFMFISSGQLDQDNSLGRTSNKIANIARRAIYIIIDRQGGEFNGSLQRKTQMQYMP